MAHIAFQLECACVLLVTESHRLRWCRPLCDGNRRRCGQQHADHHRKEISSHSTFRVSPEPRGVRFQVTLLAEVAVDGGALSTFAVTLDSGKEHPLHVDRPYAAFSRLTTS